MLNFFVLSLLISSLVLGWALGVTPHNGKVAFGYLKSGTEFKNKENNWKFKKDYRNRFITDPKAGKIVKIVFTYCFISKYQDLEEVKSVLPQGIATHLKVPLKKRGFEVKPLSPIQFEEHCVEDRTFSPQRFEDVDILIQGRMKKYGDTMVTDVFISEEQKTNYESIPPLETQLLQALWKIPKLVADHILIHSDLLRESHRETKLPEKGL